MAHRQGRGFLSVASRVQVMGMPLSRLLSLIPLLVYGVGILGIVLGSSLGIWQLGFHPDGLFPFELLGLSACTVIYLRK